jgi:DNA helicase-2/ATP-dependent DNA helicase PcrA
MAGFLEHIALVMDAEREGEADKVSIMTLHSAKGLEFETVFLPGWEEGVFPNQRSLDEGGTASLEEERRLAYVGLTRAKKRAYVWFASNRRIHGLWQSTAPSRFLDELPEAQVEVAEPANNYGGYGGYGRQPYGASRFDEAEAFSTSYGTPGWQRAQRQRGGAASQPRYSNQPLTIEGELVAKSVTSTASNFRKGERVFHQKFGGGTVAAIEGNKLTIDFDHAGQKRVLDSFVERP